MKDVKTYILITVTTPKVVPLVTEAIEKQKAILRNDKGAFIELKPHQLTRDFKEFMENSGLTLEYSAKESRRGKAEIAGVHVKVTAVNHSNYSGGAYIKVPQNDDMDFSNVTKVVKWLKNHGISWDKECRLTDNGTSCMAKLKEAGVI